MASEEGDIGALKRNVLHLLLKHPEGVRFGDFAGAFYRVHGYYPHISLYGYGSLKSLLADMKNVVVVEGDSQRAVLKLANGFHLDHWLEGENGLDSSEGEAQSLTDEEKVGGDAALAKVLASLVSLLKVYKAGLRIKRVQKFLLASYGINLKAFSIARGYKDILAFLEHQMPELNIRYEETTEKCVIKLTAVPCSPSPSLDSDFSACSLNSIPGAFTRKTSGSSSSIPSLATGFSASNSNAVPQKLVMKKPVSCSPAPSLDSDFSACSSNSIPGAFTRKTSGSSSPIPSLATGFSASNSNAVSQKLVTKKSDMAAALVPILEVLGGHPLGLNVKALKEDLEKKHGFDLETFSHDSGYEDVVACLLHVPGISVSFNNGKCPHNCVVQLLSGDLGPPHNLLTAGPSLDKLLPSSGPNVSSHELMESKLASHSSTPSQFSASLSLDSEQSARKSETLGENVFDKNPASCSPTPSQLSTSLSLDTAQSASKSNNLNQSIVEKKPAVLTEVLALVTSLLTIYKGGLRVTKMNEILLATEKVDLEQFSIAQGFKDTLELLEYLMLDLNFRCHKNRRKCVVSLGSASHSSTPSQFSASLSLDSEQSARKSETLDKNVLDKNPASCSPTPSQLSTFLSLDAEQAASKYKKLTLNIVGKKPASCSSIPSQPSASLSLDSEQSASKSKKLNQNILGKKPAVLTEVLALVTSLITRYKEGLSVLKVNKNLLAKEKIDLEQFSIAQGYKDTLEFLEHQMPKLNIRYRVDRLKCVVFFGSGKCKAKRKLHHTKAQKRTTKKCPDGNSIPPLSNAPVQFLESSRMAELVNSAPGFGDVSKVSFTFSDFSASSPHLQSLLVPAPFVSVENSSTCIPSATVPNLPSFQTPQSALVDNNSSQALPSVPPRLPSIRPSGGPPPAEKAPRLSGAPLPRKSSLTKLQPPRDLNELERQVADILARHPEGMSLFQFRAAYSAAYQQHLPLGNASSAKQRLLEMPNVVCLKGYGVQTLLLPVSSEVSPVKTGQPVSSKVENAALLPGDSSPKTVAVAKSGAVLKPSPVPKGLVVPQPHPVCLLASDQCREPGDEDCSILPEGQFPSAPKLAAPWHEDGRARVNSGYHSAQPDLAEVEEATIAPGHSLLTSNPVVSPKSCLKSPLPKLPVSQHPLFLLQSSEYPSNKESHPFPEPQPQGAPKPIASVQQQVRPTSKLVGVPFAPQSPVIFPPDSQATRWGENVRSYSLESLPTHLPSHWISGNVAPSPSIPQPVPANFTAWAQSVAYPPVPFLPEMIDNPPFYPAAFLPVSGMPSGIQVQQTVRQSSHCVQLVPSISPAQPLSLIQSNEQRKYVHTVQGQDPLSLGQKPSRTLQCAQSPAGTLPVSSPSQNKASICAHKSQMVHQPECCNHTWLDDLQHSSVPVPDKSCMSSPSDRIPSKPPASTYQRQYDDMNSLLTSPGKLPFSSQSVPANASQPLTPASSSIESNSNVLPSDPSAFMHQQQYTSESPAVTTSSRRPANLLPSPLDSTTGPPCQLLYASSINSIRDSLPSEPPTFMRQQYARSVNAAISLSTKPAHSPPSPQDSTTDPARQPSCSPLNATMDYGAPSRANPGTTISIPADNSGASFSEEQMPYCSAPQNSPPPRSFDRCVIL